MESIRGSGSIFTSFTCGGGSFFASPKVWGVLNIVFYFKLLVLFNVPEGYIYGRIIEILCAFINMNIFNIANNWKNLVTSHDSVMLF